MKNAYRYLIGTIIGIVLVIGISVYAVTTVIESSEVTYNNQTSKGGSTNVQGSIDELYQRYKDLTGETSSKYTEAILNGADPVLGEGMIPVTIDAKGKVKYANVNTPWYSYEEKRWANAVILVKSPSQSYKTGDTILEKDIESYFVWIPRYSYKIWDTGNYTSYQSSSSLEDNANAAETGGATAFRRVTGNARLIDIQFGASKNDNGTAVGTYHTNEAFTAFNTKGLWVGKFETGYNQMSSTGVPIDSASWTTENAEKNVVASSRIVVKPNVYSWRNITVGNIFKNALSYEEGLKSHMMKNTEWGAVVYLSHSEYGIGTEIRINNNSSYKTGYSAASGTNQTSLPGDYGTKTVSDNEGPAVTQAYNTPTGYLASTTGNITGIYDMSGGTHEYMASYKDGYGVNNGITATELAKTQYFDKYSTNSTWTSFNQKKLGDATGEMGPFYYYYDQDKGARVHNSWYNDTSNFVDSTVPWFYRGGNYDRGVLASQFFFANSAGGANDSLGSRLVLAIK